MSSQDQAVLPEDRRTVYQEVCKSYHAIDDFRAKLLGFLPLVSGTGIYALLTADGLPKQIQKGYIVAFSIFGFLITLGLFIYELHGIQHCINLIRVGHELEKDLLLADSRGQFNLPPKFLSLENLFTEPVAAGVIYSIVLAAWSYMAASFFAPTESMSFWIALIVGLIGFMLSCLFYSWQLKK